MSRKAYMIALAFAGALSFGSLGAYQAVAFPTNAAAIKMAAPSTIIDVRGGRGGGGGFRGGGGGARFAGGGFRGGGARFAGGGRWAGGGGRWAGGGGRWAGGGGRWAGGRWAGGGWGGGGWGGGGWGGGGWGGWGWPAAAGIATGVAVGAASSCYQWQPGWNQWVWVC